MKLTRWLPSLERLETREVPAVTATLSQTANWADLGPNNITGGQVRGITTNSTIGAVSALVPHPTLATTMFASGVNGGVWRTENALDASPTWVALTDQLASLSVSDLAIDPDNPNRLLVGIGSTADQPGTTTIGTLGNQEARIRGDRIGVLYTENALAATPTWSVLNNNIAGKLVTNVVIRGGYMIVATDLGTYRSTNNGATFTNVYPSTLDNGQTYQTRAFDQGAYDLAENSRLRDQLYLATKPGAGLGTNQVWRSDDGGASWGTVTDPQMQLSTNTVNVQVSVRDAGAFDNQVYVAVSNSSPTATAQQSTTGVGFQYAWESRAGNVSSICYSPNQGGTWIRLDAPRHETAPLDAPVTYDTTTGVITVSTVPEHRLQNGDKVRLSGGLTRILSYDGTTGAAMFDASPIVIDGYYLVDVTGPNTFTLRGLSVTGGTGNFTALDLGVPPPFGSRLGEWRRVVGTSSGENPEFLQVLASRTSAFNLFVGGDSTQFNFGAWGGDFDLLFNTGSTTTFTAPVWRGTWSNNPTGLGANDSNSTQWATLTDDGTNNGAGTRTAPGADTRELLFDAAGNMWVATGTGVYRRTNLTGSGNWVSANGNLSLGQFYDAAFDTISNVVVGATQDTGAIESNTALSNTYRSITSAADRNRQRDQEYAYESVVDDRSFAGSGFSVRYTASNNFANVRRREMLPNNTLRPVAGADTTLNFANAFTTNAPLSGITLTDANLFRDASARIVMELSATNPTRAVYGLTSVYEDSDPNGVTGFIVSNVTPAAMTGRVRTMKYGGQRPGGIQSQLNQVMAVGTSTGQLWVRGEVGPTFNNLTPPLGSGEVTDIEFDPDDWRHMFVARGGRVWETTNANDLSGAGAWRDVTAGLVTAPVPGTDLPSGNGLTTEIRTIALFDPLPGTANIGATNDVILLAGGRGGVFRRTLTVCGTGTVWSEYGSGMPNTVVNDLGFASNGFRLTAATFGRGVWSIPDVRPTLTSTLTLMIDSDGAGDSIVVSADPLDQNAVLVFANGSQIGRFTFGQFDRITINGNGGADTVQIGSLSNTRFVNYPIGAHLGGDVGDTLIVEANGSTADIRATVTPTTVGSTAGDTIFSGCGSLTYSGLNNGKLEVRTGSGNDLIIIAQGTYPNVVETNTGAGDDSVVVDGLSSGVVNAIDGAGSNDTLEVYVQPGQMVFGSDSRVFVIDNLTVNLGAGFESILLNGQGAGGTLNFTGSGLDDDFFLTSDGTGLPGESQLLAYTPNSSTTPTKMRFVNMNTVTVNAGAGNDRMIVGASGKTSFVTYQVNANMGSGAGDTVQILANGSTAAIRATITPTTVGAAGGDTLFGTNGRLTYTGLDAGEKLDIRTGSGDDRVIVSGGTYPHLIETNTGAGNDTVVLDGLMVGTVNPIDGVGTNDTIEVLVYPGQVVYGSESRVFAVGGLVFGLAAGFESILLNGQGTGGTLEFTGSGNDDDFFLTSDGTGVPGESQLIAFTPNTSTSPQRVRFVNMPVITVNAGAGNDRLIVDANGNAAGGTTKFVTYLINAGMGGQAGDQIIVNDSSTGTATRATVDPNSIASNLGTDTLFGTNGRLFYGGVNRLFLNTGGANDVVVFDSTTALTTQLNGGGGSNLALISGSAGDDTVNVGAPQISTPSLTVNTTNVQTYQVVGNGGTNVVNVGGSAGNDNLVVNQSAAQSGDVGGLPVRLVYQTVGTLNLIPYGGTNNLIWHDVSNSTFGSPINPGAGVEFLPTTATGGFIRLANGVGTSVFFDGINGGFIMNGDPTGTNTADTLSVHGVSTTGQASFGERTSANGSDTIDANENGVSVNNASLGALRSVSFGKSPNGRVGFNTVWVRGGNESGTGDTFNSSPTQLTNLLLDGGNPSSAPGDILNVTTNGPAVSSPSTDPAFGPPHTRIINRGDRASLGHLNFETVSPFTIDPNNPSGPPVPSFGSTQADLFAVGTNGNTQAAVNVYNLDGTLRRTITPFPGFGGAVKVAVGDVTGDRKSDVIVGAGPGGGPAVSVFDGQTGALVRSFFAYDATFTGGVTVAADDFNNDGRADIVTGSATVASHVKVFDGASGSLLRSFFAYAPLNGGVNVASGDVNGDGTPDIITGTTAGSSPVVRVFDGTNNALIRDFFGYDPNFVGGVNVAAGDLNGDGRDDIVLGAGPGGGPHVQVFDGATNNVVQSFFANDPFVPGAPPTAVTGGVFVAAGDFDADGRADLLIGSGSGSFARARVFKLTSGITTLLSVDPFTNYVGGISVGA